MIWPTNPPISGNRGILNNRRRLTAPTGNEKRRKLARVQYLCFVSLIIGAAIWQIRATLGRMDLLRINPGNEGGNRVVSGGQGLRTREKGPTTPIVAYAISVTACDEKELYRGFLGGAATLRHSIHLSSSRASSSKYDYITYAFVHPSATACQPLLEKLGYTVLIKEVPVDVQKEVKNNTDMVKAVLKQGCCGDKEFLKLYSLLLTDYPVVVHLDLDTLVFKPLDHLFDIIVAQENGQREINVPGAMWSSDKHCTHPIHSFFTRDYPMVNVGFPRDRVGMQGGFWIVKPDSAVFEQFLQVIRGGSFIPGIGWGGDEPHGRYGYVSMPAHFPR
jgi:hypothetical protein